MYRKKSLYLAVLVGFSAFTVSSWAVSTPDQPYSDPILYSMKKDAALKIGEAKDAAAIVHRKLTLQDGSTLAYTATTGHLVTEESQQATIFYAAYTADNQEPGKRPITFIFNGGPNAPSTVLHITGWGPMRMSYNKGTPEEPHYEILPSADSLLDKTDLVFIDPPGNGYSEAIEPAKNASFESLDADTSVFRDFIIKYLKTNNREDSPKYLYGESTGGPRAIYLAKKLNDAGFYFDGAILNSPTTGKYDLCGEFNPDIESSDFYSCSGRIPTVAAASWHYGIAGKGKKLDQFMEEVTSFVKNEYLPQELLALENNGSLPDKIVDKLTEITGFNRETLETFPYGDWFSSISKLRKFYITALGLTGCEGYPGESINPPHCPSWDIYDVRRQEYLPYDLSRFDYNSPVDGHIRNELKYTSKVRYECKDDNCLSPDLKRDHITRPPKEGEWRGDTVPTLHQAMKDNAKLRILVVSGYFDTRAPFASALMAYGDPVLDQSRIKTTVFEAGHMTYWDKKARPLIKKALNVFYDYKSEATTTSANGYQFSVEDKFPTTGF